MKEKQRDDSRVLREVIGTRPTTTDASDIDLSSLRRTTVTPVKDGTGEDTVVSGDISGGVGVTGTATAEPWRMIGGVIPIQSLPKRVGDFITNVTETMHGVSVTSGGIDQESNTGVSGLFGFFRQSGDDTGAELAAPALFDRLCTARPWEASVVTRIFSSRFFDSLCERRGGAPSNFARLPVSSQTGPAEQVMFQCTPATTPGGEAVIEWSCGSTIRSSGIGFETGGAPAGSVIVRPKQSTQYRLECARGGVRACVISVSSPRVDLVAHPARVALGARARLYWVAENVEACTLIGPGMNESGVRGSVTTNAILDSATFVITCKNAAGSAVRDTVTVYVGP